MSLGVYLSAYLAPLRSWLERSDVTDIWVNRPGEAWIEDSAGRISRESIPELTDVLLERLARQIAAASHQGRASPWRCASTPCRT